MKYAGASHDYIFVDVLVSKLTDNNMHVNIALCNK